uniref:Uncharacterized protein n=1 Tax=Siphoviridae sp. ctkyH28 TaxID=2827585 RepID=A0A8S5LMW3_9CAUD|nr:MAG TPA: hypothetical protein [Siphoviridae sp. ctkyH28]
MSTGFPYFFLEYLDFFTVWAYNNNDSNIEKDGVANGAV